MPLLIFLKQPNRAIAVKGDSLSLDEEVLRSSAKVFTIRFETIEGKNVLIARDNISHIEEISVEEIKKQKVEYEKRLKQKRQQNGQLLSPNLIFPRSKN